MSSLTESRRSKRMSVPLEGMILSDKMYNVSLGATILYGLIVNIVLCLALEDRMSHVNPIILLIGYFVSCITGILMSSRSTNPGISFIGYNLIVVPVGLVLSITISSYAKADLGFVIGQAVVLTTAITFTMIGLSIAFPRFFSGLGKLLFACLLGLIVADIVSLIFFPGASNALAWIGAILFSLYIGYDYWKAQQYPKTLDNAIDSAIDIYLDIICLFIRILEILGNKSSSSKR